MEINFTEASIENIYIHKVGNKIADEKIILSKQEVDISEELTQLLSHYFLSKFKYDEQYHFYHETKLSFNETFSYVSSIFSEPGALLEQSSNLAQHLYNTSMHPKIKGGEFYVVYFKNCYLDHVKTEVVGLFKSENKDTFLEIEPISGNYKIESKKGVNINKLDKGALVFNTQKEKGYVVSIIDNTNKSSEALYWKNNFLAVQPSKNEFHQTNQFLGIAKHFVTNKLDKELSVSKPEQIDLLNRSVDYFKKNEEFEKEEFEKTVFQTPELIESFREFDDSYRTDNQIEISHNFEISSDAVKKQARAFRKVLKLDKNFHIYIHGNKDLIEKGTDQDGRKYYKIYYDNET